MEQGLATDPETANQNTQCYMRYLMSWMVKLKEDMEFQHVKETFKHVCEAAWDRRQGNSCRVGSGTPHMTSPTVKYLLYGLLKVREDELFELLVNRLEHHLDVKFVHRCLKRLEREVKEKTKGMPAFKATHFRAV
jgi:hypothetical protein